MDLGIRRPLHWLFTVADVTQPIIGAVLLNCYGLPVNIQRKKLYDRTTKLFFTAKAAQVKLENRSLISSNVQYRDIFKELADVTVPAKSPGMSKQSVVHRILTEGQPIAQRPRRLTLEKLREAKAAFEYVIAEGICQPSNSPLYMVPNQTENGDLAGIIGD